MTKSKRERFSTEEARKYVNALKYQGYSVISRKKGMVAKIDSNDWAAIMYRNMPEVRDMTYNEMADLYRREWTEDTMIIPEEHRKLALRVLANSADVKLTNREIAIVEDSLHDMYEKIENDKLRDKIYGSF